MSITIISKQILHCKGVVIDAAGHKWACYKSGKSEQIAAFVKRLYCKQCIGPSGEKRRYLKAEQAREPQGGPLLPGPDDVEWKRFVRGQRRLGWVFSD
jgi:hypothetical protein